jgi:hypothetical protein
LKLRLTDNSLIVEQRPNSSQYLTSEYGCPYKSERSFEAGTQSLLENPATNPPPLNEHPYYDLRETDTLNSEKKGHHRRG